MTGQNEEKCSTNCQVEGYFTAKMAHQFIYLLFCLFCDKSYNFLKAFVMEDQTTQINESINKMVK